MNFTTLYQYSYVTTVHTMCNTHAMNSSDQSLVQTLNVENSCSAIVRAQYYATLHS